MPRHASTRAAATARSPWSSVATGAPNTAITASPTNCMTVPLRRGSHGSSPRGARAAGRRAGSDQRVRRSWCTADVGHQHRDGELLGLARLTPPVEHLGRHAAGRKRLSASPCSLRSTIARCSIFRRSRLSVRPGGQALSERAEQRFDRGVDVGRRRRRRMRSLSPSDPAPPAAADPRRLPTATCRHDRVGQSFHDLGIEHRAARGDLTAPLSPAGRPHPPDP